MLLRVVFFSALLSLTILAFSSALEVGDIATDSTISKEAKIKLSDFHGKSNVIVAFYKPDDASAKFVSQLENQIEAFKAKYDAMIIRQEGEAATFIIDKSGYVRWKSAAPPTIEQLEIELAKLRRDKPLEIGSLAPDFNLTEADGKTTFKLSEHKGKKNVLVTLLLQTY